MYETQVVNGRTVRIEKQEIKKIYFNENIKGKKPTRTVIRKSIIRYFNLNGFENAKSKSNKELSKLIKDHTGRYRGGGKHSPALIMKWFYLSYLCPEDVKESFKSKRNTKKKKKRKFCQTDDFLSSYQWRKTRVEALKKNDGRCELCGQSKKDGIILHVDHIKPRKKYPELALDVNNLQVLCNECNHGKGNWDETDWRQKTV